MEKEHEEKFLEQNIKKENVSYIKEWFFEIFDYYYF